MSKIRLVTESGLPINKEDAEKFRAEWRELYDKAQKKCTNNGLDMQRLSKLLARLDRSLKQKYPNERTADYPVTPQNMVELMQACGATLHFGLFEEQLTGVIKDGPSGL